MGNATQNTTQDRTKSKNCFENLKTLIPGGTNSPVRAFKGLGIDPIIVAKGSGDIIIDIDSNSYIDYCCSWGPLIAGHAHPVVVNSAQHALQQGSTFGITSQSEEKLARKIIQHMPNIEKIRFVSSGTEATMSAARLARGYTNRDIIVKFSGHYHGHADFFLVQAGSGVMGVSPTSTSAGIPRDIVANTVCLPFNDTKALVDYLTNPDHAQRIAAVILEPIAGNMGCVPAENAFMQALRKTTQDIGALLIFDEVITGFRVGLGGAQEKYHIKPDLTCLGKIIGGGSPAAAFGGRREIMDCLAPLGAVYQAGTLSGCPVAMEAGYATISLLERDGVYEELEEKADLITKPVQKYIHDKRLNACIQQFGSMFTLFFGVAKVQSMEDAKKRDLNAFAHFFRTMLSRGVYIPPMQVEAWFVSLAHTEEHLLLTRDLILEYLEKGIRVD